MRPPLHRRGRAELRALHTWIGADDRPRALTGLVPLGRVALAPFTVAAVVYAPGRGRASVFVDRRLVGQLVLDRCGLLHVRGDLWRYLVRHETAGPVRAAVLRLRRELEHRLAAELQRSVWGPVNEELDARERAARLAPVRDTRPEEAAAEGRAS